MTNDERTRDGDALIEERVHAQAITKFLWALASMLVGTWIIASLSFAWSVNGHCVEFRQALNDIRDDYAHMATDADRLRDRVESYPPAADLVGIRGDVSHLQYQSTQAVRTLNDLTAQIRDLHPWNVSPRQQATPSSSQP